LSPTRATLIYTGEPVWAGIFGRLAGERLPLLALLGIRSVKLRLATIGQVRERLRIVIC
jgi:hypothetical protein